MEMIERIQQAHAIRVISPPNITGFYWTPQRMSSIVLGRVDKVTPGKLPDAVQVPEPEQTITLTQRIGSRRGIWDIYWATIDEEEDLVVKVMDLLTFSKQGGSRRHPRAFVAQAYSDEFDAFTNYLQPLQGSVVPSFGGMFGDAEGMVFCSVYKHAGEALTWDERHSAAIGDQIIHAVKTVHATGLAVSLRNYTWICRDEDGSIKLTDFYDCDTASRITSERINTKYSPGERPTVEQFMSLCYANCLERTYRTLGRDTPQEVYDVYDSIDSWDQ